MAEQLCLSLALKDSKRDLGNKLALTILDNTVEMILKYYAVSNNFLKEDEIDSQDAFAFILDKIKNQNKVVSYEENNIIRYHKILDEFHIKDNFTVQDSIIDEYVILAKILLARLYDYRASKLEWDKTVDKVRTHL
ncbi:MAG: hypothetical protein ACRD90_06115 [Nitrosopumilaceae archaeon]